MNKNQAWRDPNISMTMSAALHQGGFDGYPSYINSKRISDCINLIQSGKADSYIDAFYNVEFRSKSTALRNFKEITGSIPSQYFSKQN
ncbi:MAG: hypothetical protein RR365_03115 [Bacteroides sp.]